MPITYCNGSRSTFTNAGNYAIDSLVEMFELTATDATNVQRWKQLKAITDKTAEETAEFTNLTTALSQKIVTSEDWNKLCDAIVNLQNMYVDKGLNEIEDTVTDYVADFAQGQINNQLGQYVNNMLLTNAHQIIISETQPTVINDAIWIKPQAIT